MISVGLDRGLSTARDHLGDSFTATLGVAVGGLPAGTLLRGHVTASHPAGAEGRAALGITLDSVETGGKTVAVNVELVGGGAGLGTILNGPDGKKADPGQIEIPTGTMFVFRLKDAVSIAP